MYPRNITLVFATLLLVGVGHTISVAVDSINDTRRPARMTAEENNTAKQTIYTGLEARYEERVIPGWNKMTDTFKIAKSKVSDAVRLRRWLHKDKSVDDVWKKLQLDKELDDVISNPNLKMLGDYLDMFNRKYPAKRMSLVGVLSVRYGEDAVAMALQSARQIWNTHKIAKKLQAQQLADWFRNGNSVDDVFQILKIGDEGPQFLASPKLFPFDDYILLVNSKNLQEKTNLFKALRNGFGDHKFATSISKATEVPSLQGRAVTYQDKLFKRWFESHVEPSNVLTRIFHVDEAPVGSREKSIASQYKTYYDEELGLDQIHVPIGISPRRM